MRELVKQQLERSNIGRRYWDAAVSRIPASRHATVLLKYCEEIRKNRAHGWGLFLWGANSQGKTYGACGVLRHAMQSGFTAYAILADVLKVSYIDGRAFDTEQSIPQRLEAVDFLLLEDVGKEYSGKGSGWAELNFENLLRKRSRDMLPTIITTNLSPPGFKERYADSAVAIVLESMIAVEVKGPDWRREASVKKASEYMGG